VKWCYIPAEQRPQQHSYTSLKICRTWQAILTTVASTYSKEEDWTYIAVIYWGQCYHWYYNATFTLKIKQGTTVISGNLTSHTQDTHNTVIPDSLTANGQSCDQKQLTIQLMYKPHCDSDKPTSVSNAGHMQCTRRGVPQKVLIPNRYTLFQNNEILSFWKPIHNFTQVSYTTPPQLTTVYSTNIKKKI
jgi:hypothetical protein